VPVVLIVNLLSVLPVSEIQNNVLVSWRANHYF